MMSTTWRIEEPASGGPARVGPQLVSFRFLLDALRRRWRTWVGCGLAGMMLGAAYVLLVPATSVGTVTLLLAHETGRGPGGGDGHRRQPAAHADGRRDGHQRAAAWT